MILCDCIPFLPSYSWPLLEQNRMGQEMINVSRTSYHVFKKIVLVVEMWKTDSDHTLYVNGGRFLVSRMSCVPYIKLSVMIQAVHSYFKLEHLFSTAILEMRIRKGRREDSHRFNFTSCLEVSKLFAIGDKQGSLWLQHRRIFRPTCRSRSGQR